MAGTDGWIILAPAATAYAVLPVGVDTIRPESSDINLHVIVNEYNGNPLLNFKFGLAFDYLLRHPQGSERLKIRENIYF